MSKETPDEMMERVQMMAEDRRGTWDLSQNDIAALKHVLALLHDVSTDADPAGTIREKVMLQDKVAAQEVLIQELRAEIASRTEECSGAHWISTEDCMPQWGSEVLFFSPGDGVEKGNYADRKFFADRTTPQNDSIEYLDCMITHWMPVPESPK